MRPRVLKRALAVLACAALTTSFAACVSTEHESAQIERESRAAVAAEQAKERAARHETHVHAHHAGSKSPDKAVAHGGGAGG